MPADHHYFVYLMASKRNGILYVGVTNDVMFRAHQHAQGMGSEFTKRYNIHMLVWFEQHQYIDQAIAREKALKKFTRKEKLALIEAENPLWFDLKE